MLNEFDHFFQEGFLKKVDVSQINVKLLMDPKIKAQLLKYTKDPKNPYFDYRESTRAKYGTLPDDVVKNLQSLYRFLEYTDNYDEFKRYFKIFSDIVGFPSHGICFVRSHGSGKDMLYEYQMNGKTRPLNDSVRLFHTSTNPNLTELTPRFKASHSDTEDGKSYTFIEVIWPERRVYFGYNKPVFRMGGSVNDEKRVEEILKSNKEFIYEYVGPKHGVVYEDQELKGGDAVYMNSDTPLKVRKITTIEEFRKGFVQESYMPDATSGTSDFDDKDNDPDDCFCEGAVSTLISGIKKVLNFIIESLKKLIAKIKSLFSNKANCASGIADEVFGNNVVTEAFVMEGKQQGVDYLTSHNKTPDDFAEDIYVSLAKNGKIIIEADHGLKLGSTVKNENRDTKTVNNNVKVSYTHGDIRKAISTIESLDLLRQIRDCVKKLTMPEFTPGDINKCPPLIREFDDAVSTRHSPESWKKLRRGEHIELNVKDIIETQSIMSELNDISEAMNHRKDQTKEEDLLAYSISGIFRSLSSTFISIQMCFNDFTNRLMLDANYVAPKYRNKIKDPTMLAKFVSQCIKRGVPPKYISYNTWLLASKSLKGKSKMYDPVKGQSRFVLFPEDKSVVYKIAMSGFGLSANKNEAYVTNIVKKHDSIRDYFALILDSYENGAIVKQERSFNRLNGYNIPEEMFTKSNDEMRSRTMSASEIADEFAIIQRELKFKHPIEITDLDGGHNMNIDTNRGHIVLIDYGMLVGACGNIHSMSDDAFKYVKDNHQLIKDLKAKKISKEEYDERKSKNDAALWKSHKDDIDEWELSDMIRDIIHDMDSETDPKKIHAMKKRLAELQKELHNRDSMFDTHISGYTATKEGCEYMPLSEFEHYFQEGLLSNIFSKEKRAERFINKGVTKKIPVFIEDLNKISEAYHTMKYNRKLIVKMYYPITVVETHSDPTTGAVYTTTRQEDTPEMDRLKTIQTFFKHITKREYIMTMVDYPEAVYGAWRASEEMYKDIQNVFGFRSTEEDLMKLYKTTEELRTHIDAFVGVLTAKSELANICDNIDLGDVDAEFPKLNLPPLDENGEETPVVQESMSAKERNALKNSDFAYIKRDAKGKVVERKYPINNERHVKSAAHLFPRGIPDDPEIRKKVANKILRKAHSYGMDTSGWTSLNKAAGKKTVKEGYEESIVDSLYMEADGKKVRAQFKDSAYFDKFIVNEEESIKKFKRESNDAKNSIIAGKYMNLIAAKYSNGESKKAIRPDVVNLFKYVRGSNDISSYNEMVDYLSLAILFDIEHAKLYNVIKCTKYEDPLVISLKQHIVKNAYDKETDCGLKHPTQYKTFNDALNGDIDGKALNTYINSHWYPSCKGRSFYDTHKKNTDTYCGYWCWVGGAVAKLKSMKKDMTSKYVPTDLI